MIVVETDVHVFIVRRIVPSIHLSGMQNFSPTIMVMDVPSVISASRIVLQANEMPV